MQSIYKTLLIITVFQKLYPSSKQEGILFKVESELWLNAASQTRNNISSMEAENSFNHQNRNENEEYKHNNFFDCDDYQTICCNITLAICGCIPCGLFFMDLCKK